MRHLNLENHDDLILVDRLGTSEKWRHLVPLRFADYLDAEEFFARIAAQPDAFGEIATVFHLGACSSTTERDASYLIANNVRRSQEIARWAFARGARFVYASSAATYGAREHDMREDLDPHALRPLNMYGYSKHLFDLWMRREQLLGSRGRGQVLQRVRPQRGPQGHDAQRRRQSVRADPRPRRIELFKSYRPGIADGEQTRDFLYVKDAAAITAFLARTRARRRHLQRRRGHRPHVERPRAAPCSPRWNCRRASSTSRCPRCCAASTSTAPSRRSTGLRDAGYAEPITPLEAAVSDYVRNYLVTGTVLGGESDAASSPLPTLSATR